MKSLRRLLLGLIVLLLVGAVGVYAMYWRPAIAAIAPPPAAAFSPQLIEQGARLAGMGNCAACHTLKGGADFAGGRGLDTPFGTIYATNITPDLQTGIGGWSQDTFKRAMREGVRQDGAHLFPVFPYTHFAKVSDEDLTSLYAYFMTRTAVHAEAKANTVPFPLNVRALQAGWKLLFFDKGLYRASAAKSPEWNRGAYLAEGLGHCAACHTPRNLAGAEIRNKPYLGAKIDGWFAPALTAANTSPLPWTEPELYALLRSGATTLHGTAAGPMSQVVHEGLSKMPDADIHAIAAYFADIDGAAQSPVNTAAVQTRVLAASGQVASQYGDHGAALYLAACASCHTNSNGQASALRPELGFNSALTAADPTNLLQVIVHGVGRDEGAPGLMMPGFGASMSNRDIAELAHYLRRSRTTQPQWTNVDDTLAAVRKP